MDPLVKAAHMNFEHNGVQDDYYNTCALCKNFVDGSEEPSGDDIGVNISQQVPLVDVFGAGK